MSLFFLNFYNNICFFWNAANLYYFFRYVAATKWIRNYKKSMTLAIFFFVNHFYSTSLPSGNLVDDLLLDLHLYIETNISNEGNIIRAWKKKSSHAYSQWFYVFVQFISMNIKKKKQYDQLDAPYKTSIFVLEWNWKISKTWNTSNIARKYQKQTQRTSKQKK